MYALRSTFIILLILLQLVSPLLHAHVGAHFSAEGIHIPGLEIISDSKPPAFKNHSSHIGSGEVIFSVASGIKSPTDFYADAAKPLLLTNEISLACSLIVREINFSPHPTWVITHFFHHTYASRAPPI